MQSQVQRNLEARMRRALAHLFAGERDQGLAIYAACLSADLGDMMPVGGHIALLERAGKADTAAELRDYMLRHGGIVARREEFDGSPVDPVAEYDSLFARGHFNARMVRDYLFALSGRGEAERVRAVFDVERLFRTVQLDPALGPAVRELMLREEAAGRVRTTHRAVQGIARIDRIDERGDPMPALTAAIRTEIDRYLADWAASGHLLAPHVPDRRCYVFWGHVARGEGYDLPHLHSAGWATGIYYPSGIEGEPEGEGGALCVGPPRRLPGGMPGGPDFRLRPEPGMLVLMPSWYTHWTLPLGRPGLRLAIAFDVNAER